MSSLLLAIVSSTAWAAPTVSSKELDVVPAKVLEDLADEAQAIQDLDAEILTKRDAIDEAKDERVENKDELGTDKVELDALKAGTAVAKEEGKAAVDVAKDALTAATESSKSLKTTWSAKVEEIDVAKVEKDKDKTKAAKEIAKEAKAAYKAATAAEKEAASKLKAAKKDAGADLDAAKEAVSEKKEEVVIDKGEIEEASDTVVLSRLEIDALQAKKDVMVSELELAKAKLVKDNGGEIDVAAYDGAVKDAKAALEVAERAVAEAKITP